MPRSSGGGGGIRAGSFFLILEAEFYFPVCEGEGGLKFFTGLAGAFFGLGRFAGEERADVRRGDRGAEHFLPDNEAAGRIVFIGGAVEVFFTLKDIPSAEGALTEDLSDGDEFVNGGSFDGASDEILDPGKEGGGVAMQLFFPSGSFRDGDEVSEGRIFEDIFDKEPAVIGDEDIFALEGKVAAVKQFFEDIAAGGRSTETGQTFAVLVAGVFHEGEDGSEGVVFFWLGEFFIGGKGGDGIDGALGYA